ncbi:MAG: hypothetical protein JWM74_3853 [Myxococcaceae bacterium]|nr:hypothetical protein [Myxococcaceae bacterium]
MKTQMIALTCALAAAACGGSDRTAQDPSTVETTSGTSSMTDTKTPASGVTTSTPSASNTESSTVATGGATAAAKPASTGTTSTSANSGSTSNASSNATTPGAMAPPPPAGATANANPGAADQTKNADNTKINDRDRHGAVTPVDQGNSDSELKITAAIRKGVVGDKSLGFNAKNIKIITVGSKVTLRGPVSSDQERSNIEARAKATPGVTEVDNQIEVKK